MDIPINQIDSLSVSELYNKIITTFQTIKLVSGPTVVNSTLKKRKAIRKFLREYQSILVSSLEEECQKYDIDNLQSLL